MRCWRSVRTLRADVDDLPFDFMGKKACIAKAMEMGSGRLDGKLGNIVYDKNRVQE